MDQPASQIPPHGEFALEKGFRLGDWLVRPESNALERRYWGGIARIARIGSRVGLEPRPMQLLVALARARGAVLTREQLRVAVWQRAYISDEVITVAVRAVRKALGDDAQKPAYIQTFPGQGYRLVCAVEPLKSSLTGGMARLALVGVAVAVAVALGFLRGAEYEINNPPSIPLTGIPENAAQMVGPIPDLGTSNREAFVRASYVVLQGDSRQLEKAALVLDDLIARYPGQPDILINAANGKLRAFRFSGFRRDYIEQADSLLLRAVALAPDNSAGLGALAQVRYYRDWDITAADALFQAGMAADSIDPRTRRRYVRFLGEQGRFAEARAILASATASDPDVGDRRDEVMLLYFEGRFDEAVLILNEMLAQRSEPGNAYALLSQNLEAMGRDDEALEALVRHYEIRAYDAEFVTVLQRTYDEGGTKAVNAHFRDFLIGLKARGIPQSPVNIARYALGAGDREEAIARLREAMEARDPGILSISVDPAFRALWGLPIFDSLVAQIHSSAGG